MKLRMVSGLALCAMPVMTVVGCGARTPLDGYALADGGGDDASDAAPGPDVVTFDVAARDVVVDTVSPIEAAPACTPTVAPDPDSGDMCNDLVAVGAEVPIVCDTTDPAPTPAGGTIVEGTYVLASSTFYGGCPFAGEQDRITWNICGDAWGTVQEITLANSGPVTSTFDLSVARQPNSLVLTPTCGPQNTSQTTFGYTATPTTLTFFVGGYMGGGMRVDLLAKQ